MTPARQSDADILRLLNAYAGEVAPRYTSYPTANRFEPEIPQSLVRDWLARIDPARPVSLYVHIPFCAQQCWYCGCNMKLAARYQPVQAYVDTLLAEVDLVADAAPAGLRFGHLHFGGGTPSVLSPHDMERVLNRLHARFTAAPGAEIAIEIDPRTVSEALLSGLGALGFNRASLGVQDFDPAVQAAINRVQTPDLIARTTAILRDTGVDRVNFDLLYGLPHQTARGLERTINTSLTMAPDRVALFGYAHVPWFAKNQRMIPEEALPGAAERARQALAARRTFQAAGYDCIGIDHFATPHDDLSAAMRQRTLRRNFQGYTTDAADVMIGFGASAIGQTSEGFVQAIGETNAYARAIAAGRLPVERGLGVNDEDRLRARVIEDIMCFGETDFVGRARQAGRTADHFDEAVSRMSGLIEDGLVRIADGRIIASEAGLLLARLIAACFDSYRVATPGKHAVAI